TARLDRPVIGIPIGRLAHPRPAGSRRRFRVPIAVPRTAWNRRRAPGAPSMSSERGRQRSENRAAATHVSRIAEFRVQFCVQGAPAVGADISRRMSIRSRRRRGVRWGGITIAVLVAIVLGSTAGLTLRHYLAATEE